MEDLKEEWKKKVQVVEHFFAHRGETEINCSDAWQDILNVTMKLKHEKKEIITLKRKLSIYMYIRRKKGNLAYILRLK